MSPAPKRWISGTSAYCLAQFLHVCKPQDGFGTVHQYCCHFWIGCEKLLYTTLHFCMHVIQRTSADFLFCTLWDIQWHAGFAGHMVWSCGSYSTVRHRTRMLIPMPSSGVWATTACTYLCLPAAQMGSGCSCASAGEHDTIHLLMYDLLSHFHMYYALLRQHFKLK